MAQNSFFLDAVEHAASRPMPIKLPPWQGYCAKNYSDLLKVTGNVLNIEYYFWWRGDCFGLLIHNDIQFHFMVSITDEYKYK